MIRKHSFPSLETGADGKVGYSRKTIQTLFLIKRLIEGGFRPAQIVGRSPLEIERLSKAMENDRPDLGLNETTRKLLDLLKKTDITGLSTLEVY